MDTFKQIRIIFYALIAGQLLYLIIAFILAGSDSINIDKGFSAALGFIIPVIIIALVIGSKFIYKRLISVQGRETSLQEKINSYRNNNIIKFALLESANILSITFYLLTGDFLYLGMFVIVLALDIMYFPGKEKFIEDFQLTGEDLEKLNKI